MNKSGDEAEQTSSNAVTLVGKDSVEASIIQVKIGGESLFLMTVLFAVPTVANIICRLVVLQ